ncbi:SseB family protein [Microbacterium azadirachtae]|uniref:SseB family protein n=1 Tax=Microbacterium azadirachtae TaxID=582680 RepID=UPI00088AFE1A|nr:SseB family protein [Microbacterium azadirachtae]SDM08835.1 SseB protein N-terminal domain-containing protein [Microbacterium azadirachtae]SEG33946.1 SseB protein N-terminal domain-containing protein [Microbacterium azadirachtae]SEG36757.1 SseB protein N-terminal domain-containing protein [Microbacterium azadirachtae]
MGLFSRRSKQDDVVSPESASAAEGAAPDAVAEGAGETGAEETAAEAAPVVNVSVQAFRGLGAPAGPEVAAPADAPDAGHDLIDPVVDEAPVPPAPAPSGRPPLPLAPADPPEQTESIPGMPDNVLLREALSMLGTDASQAELLGVLRQSLQGNLFLRVSGDAGEQIREGKPLAVAVVNDGENSFMLAFSSAAAVRDSVQQGDEDPSETSAVVQPVQAVYQNVIEGPFAGLIIDNASEPHRVVFPSEILQKALEEADPTFAVKALLATPRAADSEARVAEALTTARLWVAVSDVDGDGQYGVAEAHTPDGQRYLQLFSHPLEVIALGRGDQPMPFSAEQIGTVMVQQPGLSGVLIDAAGPAITVGRDALAPVIALAPAE